MSAGVRRKADGPANKRKNPVWAPRNTGRKLPDDLTVTIGLLIKEMYEDELEDKDNELEELRESRNDAVLSDIRTALFVELEAAEDAINNGEDFEPTDGSLPVTKALLEQNDWVTLELLFDEESVTKMMVQDK
ncbi:hypothetical protein WJX84_011205 [Apatococcus fuscideae]|uniref:Uncharacterized protein n=1 Tax=Apatococcus fuscideae TaxID=2026836 RepID=A0AAW1TAM1_9CHLO